MRMITNTDPDQRSSPVLAGEMPSPRGGGGLAPPSILQLPSLPSSPQSPVASPSQRSCSPTSSTHPSPPSRSARSTASPSTNSPRSWTPKPTTKPRPPSNASPTNARTSSTTTPASNPNPSNAPSPTTPISPPPKWTKPPPLETPNAPPSNPATSKPQERPSPHAPPHDPPLADGGSAPTKSGRSGVPLLCLPRPAGEVPSPRGVGGLLSPLSPPGCPYSPSPVQCGQPPNHPTTQPPNHPRTARLRREYGHPDSATLPPSGQWRVPSPFFKNLSTNTTQPFDTLFGVWYSRPAGPACSTAPGRIVG